MLLLFIPHCIIFFYRFFFSVILFFCMIGTITEIYLGLLNPSADNISKEIALENVDLKHGHIDTGTDREALHDSTKTKDNKEGNLAFACFLFAFVYFVFSLFLFFLIHLLTLFSPFNIKKNMQGREPKFEQALSKCIFDFLAHSRRNKIALKNTSNQNDKPINSACQAMF